MKRIIHNFFGFTRIKLKTFDPALICTDLLGEFNDKIFDIEISGEDNCLNFSCSSFAAKKILKSKIMNNVNILMVENYGLPEIIIKNKKRIGLLIGILLFIAVLKINKLFVWDIVISGNNSVTEEEITETLELAGFSKGSLIRPEKIPGICNKCIILNKDITWISINMSGRVAFVEVSERVEPISSKKPSMSGLISGSDGVVELVNVSSGTALVKNGDSVTNGQMLISPIAKGKDENEYIVGADGEIIARTYEKFLVIVNFEKYVQENNNVILNKYSLNFLGKKLNLDLSYLGKNENFYFNNSRGKIQVWDNIFLPVTYEKISKTTYNKSKSTLTTEQARSIAYSEMYEIINSELLNVEILSTTFSEEENQENFVLKCEVECLKNIVEYN